MSKVIFWTKRRSDSYDLFTEHFKETPIPPRLILLHNNTLCLEPLYKTLMESLEESHIRITKIVCPKCSSCQTFEKLRGNLPKKEELIITFISKNGNGNETLLADMLTLSKDGMFPKNIWSQLRATAETPAITVVAHPKAIETLKHLSDPPKKMYMYLQTPRKLTEIRTC